MVCQVYKFGVHDNLGANSVLLGCDISIDDHKKKITSGALE